MRLLYLMLLISFLQKVYLSTLTFQMHHLVCQQYIKLKKLSLTLTTLSGSLRFSWILTIASYSVL
jgi:hypothetical protein